MDNMNESQWANALQAVAADLDYPPTPSLAVAVRQQLTVRTVPPRPRPRLQWAAAVAAILVALALGLMAVPQTRAAVVELVTRIGAIRIFVTEPTPDAPATNTPQPAGGVVPGAGDLPVVAGDSSPTPVPLALLAALPGEATTLQEVDQLVDFPVLRAPAGGELGPPDQILIHAQMGHKIVTFVWMDPENSRQPVLTFTQIPLPDLALKIVSAGQSTSAQVGDVTGRWIEGPHNFHLSLDRFDTNEQIASNVLLWSDGGMTYRLEGAIDRATAVGLAESLVSP